MADMSPKNIFAAANIDARRAHEKGGTYEDLVSDSIFNAIYLIVGEKARLNPKNPAFERAALGVSGLRHVIKGAVGASIDNLRHPDHSFEDHHDYLSSVLGHIKGHIQRDLDKISDSAKQALKVAGIDV